MTRRAALVMAFAAVAAAAPAAAQGVSGPLVLYTSQLEADAAQTVEAFRQRHPGVSVEWIRAGTNALMPRLTAEFAAGNPRPDVLLIADALTMEGLRVAGRLRASPDVALGAVPPERHDPTRHYFATKLITTGIAVNARAPFVPARWADLLRPEARNLTAMPAPSVSGAAAIHVQTLAQSQAHGWDYLTRLSRNGLAVRGNNGAVMQSVAGGEKAFGIIVDFLPIRQAAAGAPVRFVFPEDGVSAVTEPAAILATARNVPAAVAFVSFLLSREGQELASRQGFLPADPSVAPPAGFPDPRTVRVLGFDAARAAAERDRDLRRFQALAEE